MKTCFHLISNALLKDLTQFKMRKLDFLEIIPTVLLFLALGFAMYLFFIVNEIAVAQDEVYKELKNDEVGYYKRLQELEKEHDSLLIIKDSLIKELQSIRNPHN